MARSNNLPAKMYTAGERTHLKLRFRWDAGDGNSTHTSYIDLAQALSQVNRRAYRQGLYYYVASVTFSNGTAAYCQVNTLPDTWMTKLAWSRAYRKYMQMVRRANNHSNVSPKYHDFKTQMVNGGTAMSVAYGDVDSSTYYSSDDWVISKFVTDDPPSSDPQAVDEFISHMLGAHIGSAGSWTSIGLIRSLDDTWRRQPADGLPELDPDADTDPIANMFDAGDSHDDVRENLNTDGDEPPYNHNLMTGSGSVEETCVGAILRVGDGGPGIARAPGFCAPLGLLQVNVSDFGAGTSIDIVEMIIEMVPGTYHGVHAERVI